MKYGFGRIGGGDGTNISKVSSGVGNITIEDGLEGKKHLQLQGGRRIGFKKSGGKGEES